MVSTLSAAVKKQSKADLKGFVIFIDGDAETIKKLNQELKADNVALCTMPSTDKGVKGYEINLKAKTTVLLYKKRIVTAKLVDYHAETDQAEFAKQLDALTR